MSLPAIATEPLTPASNFKSSISLVLSGNRNVSLPQLKQIQAQIYRRQLHTHPVFITHLISAAAISGNPSFAESVFRSFTGPIDLILLNTLLKGYVLNSLYVAALVFFVDRFLGYGFLPDSFTYPYVLKACAAVNDCVVGRQIHASLAKNFETSSDVVVLNSLVDMYFKCGENESAKKVFGQIERPNSASRNIMMAGLLGSGDLMAARKVFDEMPERDVVSWNTMISAYTRAGEMDKAQDLFDRMPERNTVSWNALISGYAQNDQKDDALSVFSQMLESGARPDNTSLLSSLSACAGACSTTNRVVEVVISFAKSVNSVSVATALFNLYAKTGKLEEARMIFDSILEKDVITWNAMLAGYAQNHRPAEAIELFQLMQHAGVKPDSVTMVSLIDCCSQLGALGLGEWVHAYIWKNKIELDVYLNTSLIDMYAKCGDLSRSQVVFSEMRQRDLTSWNAMINSLAIHGEGNEALKTFSSMEQAGIVPNDVTFVGLLSACSHGGLLQQGLDLFKLMQNRYGITPRIEHYGCVVDLLGRAGRLTEARKFIDSMHIEPDAVIWGALLGACRCHRNVELAEEAARRLVELDPRHDGNYVLLSNVYASMGRWSDVEQVRAQMRAGQVRKTPGCSAVEMHGAVHEFTAGDRSHPMTDEIYSFWDQLADKLKLLGYEPNTASLLKNLEEEEREEALYRHSEKLALSFALIGSEKGTPIRIVKNLRICNDCHRAMELVSELEQREITVRDRSRFHHFSNGRCSCGGYW